jgi:photosystem II stability/assembly factor-like uncharacterized protein
MTKTISTIVSLAISAILLLSNTPSFSQGLNSVYSKDGNEVWAVGSAGSLLRSPNGGSTWYGYTLGSSNLNTIFAINQKVWAGGASGTYYYSTNAGASWNTVSIPITEIKSVYFADENIGWLCGSDGKIFNSMNGGATWTLQTTPVSSQLNSIRFINSMIGAACGNNGTVVYTTNGGTSWIQSPTPTSVNLLSLDQKSNVIITTAADGFILKSTGRTRAWSIIDYKIMTKSEVTSVCMLNTNTFYSCGGGGFIRKSTDGGNTFVFQQNPMMSDLVSIFFYDNNKGWAVSSKNNAVMNTMDGGSTWLLPTGTNVNYTWVLKGGSGGNIGNDLALHPKNKNGVYCCCGSNVYRSLDRGETWTMIATIPYSQSAHSFYVSLKDTNLMLAAIGSSGGRIVKSTNYGLTWTVTWGPGALTSYGMPIEMDPNHPDTVFLAPNSSVILRSVDFGTTWVNYGTTSFTDPCDVVVLPDYSNIVYLGDQSGGGKFWKSVDFGVNWTLMYNAGGSEIPMIGVSRLDYNLIYFTNWGGSGFRKSTDQGITFSLVSATSSTWGTDIAKDDPTVVAFGLYSGSGNGYLSTNSGSSFVTTNIGGSVNYGILFYNRGNIIAQQGSGIYKLNVTYDVPIITGISQNNNEIPKEFKLFDNYPNPFNPNTVIRYEVPVNSFVTLKVYDVLGKEAAILVNADTKAGVYELQWNASDFSSGVYLYKLEARQAGSLTGSFVDTKKMVLLK